MKKVYASTVINGQEGWGDGIPVLFYVEAFRNLHPDWKFAVWDGPCCGTGWSDFTWRHRDHINAPFVNHWLDGPPKASAFDAVLATHYSHPIQPCKLRVDGNWIKDPEYGGFMPPMHYDKEIEIIRIHSDRGVLGLAEAKFKPTLDIRDPIPTGLPEKYIAFQIRKDDGTARKKVPRLALLHEECEEWAREFIKKCDLPVVLLSDQVEGGIDASKLTLWQKIWVGAHAERSYVSHSGFGMIIAMYAGREKVKVVNVSRAAAYRNPCLGVFNNVETRLDHQQNSPYVTASYVINNPMTP